MGVGGEGANGILTQSSEICDEGVSVCVCVNKDRVTTDNDTDVKHSAVVVFSSLA